jgi:hypothetical protein
MICFSGKSTSRTSLRQINPTGKLILIFGNHVKPLDQKYFASHFCKSEVYASRLIPEEGRWPSSPNVGMGLRWTRVASALSCADETPTAYGEVVWS